MRPATLSRRALLAAPIAIPALARAQSAKPVRIGVLTDETGPYADSGGVGSVFAAQAAVNDFGGTVLGQPIEVLHADTRNKPDIASAIARGWYDASADLITDLPVTPVAVAVQQVAREKGKSVIATAAASTELTAKLCAPVSTHWADDTHALAVGTSRRVVERGGKTWFFITVDYTFGLSMQKQAADVIVPAGGRVVGTASFPLGNTDFASQLLAAQNSIRTDGADVIGLISVGDDQVNLIKQAHEFGLVRGDRPVLAAFLVYITDIHALGLPAAQGLTFSSSFYWDQGEAARAFARRFFAARGAMPTRNHASIYASTLHFLKAMAKAGTRDALAVNQAMRAMPADYLGHPATVRADGRALYDLTLYQVKVPGASTQPWNYYAALATIPAADAFAPMTPACAAG